MKAKSNGGTAMPRPHDNAVSADASPLPAGWTWTTIGAITEPVEKVDPSINPQAQFAYLDIASIDNTINQITEPKTYLGKDAPSRARQKVRTDDVLFSTVRTYLKNIAQVPAIYDGQIASTGFAVLRASDEVTPRYIFYYCLTATFLNALAKIQRGTSYPAVRDGDVREQPIPLAPLPEQRRIVAAIESLFTKLDAGVAALRRAQANLRRYKASVLKAACEGNLVDNSESSGSAEELLAELGKSPLHDESLPLLPTRWCWARIADIGADMKHAIVDGPFGSMLKTSDYVENGEVPVITISNIELGFKKNNLRFIAKEKFETVKRSAVNPGDILVAKIGASYGKVGYYPDWMPIGIIPANLLKITPHQRVSKEFVYYYLKSSGFKRKLDKITKSTAQPAFNVSMFRELPIPLPPLAEQRRIAAEVERRLSVVAALEATLAHNLARAQKLRQAILQRAFAGRLVGQESTHKSA